MRALEVALSLLLAAFGLFAAFEASKLRSPAASLTQDVLGPGFFPFWLGVAVAGLATVGLLQTLVRRADAVASVGPRSWGAVGIMILAIVLYVGAVGLFGFVLATFLFVLGTLIALKQPVTLSGLTAAVVTGTLYLVFARWLQVPLPVGPFGW